MKSAWLSGNTLARQPGGRGFDPRSWHSENLISRFTTVKAGEVHCASSCVGQYLFAHKALRVRTCFAINGHASESESLSLDHNRLVAMNNVRVINEAVFLFYYPR